MTSTEYLITELHTQIDTPAPDFVNIGVLSSAPALVGMLKLEYADGYAYIHMLFVDEAHRGKQLGTRLIEHAFEICRGKGIATVGISVKATNTGALRLYERLGFLKFQKYNGDDAYLQLVKVL